MEQYLNSSNDTPEKLRSQSESCVELIPSHCNNSLSTNNGQTNPAFDLTTDQTGSCNGQMTGDTCKTQQVFYLDDSMLENNQYASPDNDACKDPWTVTEAINTRKPWSDLTKGEKVIRVIWGHIVKPLLLVAFLYLFICSLDFLGSALRLLGGKAAGAVFKENQLLNNPVAGLMIGVLSTVIIQSSSATTSIAISLVAAEIMTVKTAIPIVMGANIGTSVTNTLVSMGQITDRDDFRRAFAGATVHDMFNWITVIVLLPLEVATGYLYSLSKAVIDSLPLKTNKAASRGLLKRITKPFTALIIKVDKKVIEKIAQGEDSTDMRMVKQCCKKGSGIAFNMTGNVSYGVNDCEKRCEFLFNYVSDSWSDVAIGGVLLLLAVILLIACLLGIVKTLNSMLKGHMAVVIKKYINADFPGRWGYFTGYIAILIGAGFTMVIQSSSVFTSSLTPLVGIGVLRLERMYPLTLGANIGTTATGILAALAQNIDNMPNSLQVALCHLFFNLSGVLLFYPIPFMRFPIQMAKYLGNETGKYRWFAILYLVVSFLVIPWTVFGLSIAGLYVMIGVLVPLIVLVLIIAIIKVIQQKRPQCLPHKLRNWKFLPVCMRSLKPEDDLVIKLSLLCSCGKKCRSYEKEEDKLAAIDEKSNHVMDEKTKNGVDGKTKSED